MIDPDMPAQQLRMHMGEMTAQEMRTAKAAIRWANTTAQQSIEEKDRLLREAVEALEHIDTQMVDGPTDDWVMMPKIEYDIVDKTLSAIQAHLGE